MDRRSFFRKLFIGAIAVQMKPEVLCPKPEAEIVKIIEPKFVYGTMKFMRAPFFVDELTDGTLVLKKCHGT